MGAVIFYDGVCNLCNRSVRFVVKRDVNKIFRFSWLQSVRGKEIQVRSGLGVQNQGSVILEIGQKIYLKSDAVLEIMRRLPGIWHYLVFLKIIPKFIRDGLYDMVAENRYHWFGRKQSCLIPTNELKERFM